LKIHILVSTPVTSAPEQGFELHNLENLRFNGLMLAGTKKLPILDQYFNMEFKLDEAQPETDAIDVGCRE